MGTDASGSAMGSTAQGTAPTNGAGAVGPVPQAAPAAHVEPGRPLENVSQEVRLAVVMYGGVSLAIYMNGVAEELYHLVRATAPGQGNRQGRALLVEPADGEPATSDSLTSTETVYRRLGQMLVRGSRPAALDDLDRDSEIRTRFVVDVLSGTSAGGINAIFLAKALANGQPFERLKSFWIKEGAISSLINDQSSVGDLDGALPVPGEPRSLLNSQRMYVKLLEAFGDMSKQGQNGAPDAYVDEVDLYVTTTDIRGVPVPLKLNEPLFELRHRHVFHFRYGPDEVTNRPMNHFEQANDPYLAFVARCTSAFPFALEPVQETDIEKLLASVDSVRATRYLPIPPERWDVWRKFGPIDASLTEADRQKRAYGDGGYLDNKPFGYAIDALARRQPTLPVDRKLLFVDPSPEHPNWARQGDNPPDVVENVSAALSLARYETIRDDVRRILDSNRLLEKVQRITARQDIDLERVMPKAPPPAPMEEFIRQDLGAMVERWGIAYAALHRIKVTEVTDELATYIASAAGFDLESELYAVVRALVRGWRERRFVRFRTADDDRTENELLFRFDFPYRLRRLRFLLRKIDELSLEDATHQDSTMRRAIERFPKELRDRMSVADAEVHRAVLTELRSRLDDIRRELLRAQGSLRSAGPLHPLLPALKRLNLNVADLTQLLGQRGDGAGDDVLVQRAAVYLDDPEKMAAFDVVADAIARVTLEATEAASGGISELLPHADAGADELSPKQCVCSVLRDYYDKYEYFDMAILSTLYGTGLSQEDPVEIVRISPEVLATDGDAVVGPGGKKLGGSRLFHFGAFLDEGWRRGDVMWGRLDGAERIITSMLPATDQATVEMRQRLIDEAHTRIISEELCAADKDVVRSLMARLAEGLREQSGAKGSEKYVRDLVAARLNDPDSPVFTTLRSLMEPDELRTYLRNPTYEVHPPEPNPRMLVEALARSTQVVGKMLEGLTANTSLQPQAALIARLGQLAWGLVLVAIPQSFPNLLFAHWRNLLGLFGVFLIVLAVVMGNWSLASSGLILVVSLAILSVAVHALGTWLTRRPTAPKKGKAVWRWLRGPVVLVGVVIALLAMFGVLYLAERINGWLGS